MCWWEIPVALKDHIVSYSVVLPKMIPWFLKGRKGEDLPFCQSSIMRSPISVQISTHKESFAPYAVLAVVKIMLTFNERCAHKHAMSTGRIASITLESLYSVMQNRLQNYTSRNKVGARIHFLSIKSTFRNSLYVHHHFSFSLQIHAVYLPSYPSPLS